MSFDLSRLQDGSATPSRRKFITGIAAAGALASFGSWARRSDAANVPGASGNPNVLTGTQFDLTIDNTPVNITGRASMATAVNGSVPAPVLRWREGETVTLRVANRMATTTSIHWHGILLPFQMDGVPGLSFAGVGPGETFTYRFDVKQSGTYWYHSHSRFQEQTGVYGSIVVEPRNGERHRAERDYVLMLSDWSDDDPETVMANLKKMSDFYNFNEPTAVDFARDASSMGVQQALAKRKMWNQMRMSPTDLSDVTGHHYTYLVNGESPDGNWTGLFKPGEKVRLRVINGSSQSIFDLRIPGLKMQVVAADGQDVEPVTVDEFRIATAEIYDVIVEPKDDRAFTIFAQSIDRMGFARATLAPRAGMQAEVPAMDKPQWLTMTDMMGSMAMGGDMAGMDHGTMDHGAMGHGAMKMPMAMGADKAGMKMPATRMAKHARTEYGPGVDMRVDMPRDNIDDPGIGLRDNGRRVLTYADLHTIGGPLDKRGPGREIELHLTGNMERYMWSFDGQKFSDSKPLHFRHGERLRIILVNDTMMPHPIHLHGLWSELESPDGKFQVRKHTIMVQPAQRVSYLVNADALGNWAYHCHLLYHMEAGMFRKVVVS
ncbi:copper resistance system multicopper oxidase [Variovorax sp. LG9.2]|uniref:copper resistance system multicopper oxidase n=1 Tax=Variovorax sp. LG9.2 TaxID=3048626 RepID=UPI002B234CF8|nr:copper resistance system multicopper oxidase [Variovorax sp. LG9.2]MEB0059673.1 copper resistance system multicopper oxidase [Variovorax sp. LG9.2]